MPISGRRPASRSGRGSAFASRHFPERIYEQTDGAPRPSAPQRPLVYRAARYPIRILRSTLTFKWIRAVAEWSYLAGYLMEFAIGSRRLPPAPPPGRMVTFESPRALPGAVPPAPAVPRRRNALVDG